MKSQTITEKDIVQPGEDPLDVSVDLEKGASCSVALPAIDESSEVNLPTTMKSGCASSDDDVSDDGMLCIAANDDFAKDAGFVTIPMAGSMYRPRNNQLARSVPNGCAICLSSFEVGDQATWSSNEDCSHAFHYECILDWFKMSGRRHCRRRRRREELDTLAVLNYAHDPLLKITNFPMDCPCCRQTFISKSIGEGTPEKDDVDTEEIGISSSRAGTVVSSSNGSEDSDSEVDAPLSLATTAMATVVEEDEEQPQAV